MKILSLKIILCAAIFAVTGNTYAQEIFTNQEAAKLYKGTVLVRSSKHSVLPSFIRFDKSNRLPEANFATWMKENMSLNTDMSFDILKVEHDKLGFTHTRLKQTYKGIPIEAATWISHTKNNMIHSMNGLIFEEISASSTATITEEQALEFAKTHIGAASYKWEITEEEMHLKWEQQNPEATHFPTAELVFAPLNFELKKEKYKLAYKFDIYAHSPISRSYVFVDAQTGEILGENSIIHHIDTPGTAETAYSGSQPIIADSFGGEFRLRDGSRGLGIRTFDVNNAYGYGGAVDFTDADNVWNNVNPEQDEYAGDAHWGTEVCYDYFNDEHGRNSIDGAGYQLNSYVHYGVNYVNAFWDGTRMTYGDGNGAPYTPLTSLDIAGHEITHGLTNFTANLIYYAESGALNESFSDIFGTAIESFGRPADWDWLLSADIGASFRSLSDPGAYGHPDTYFGTNWAPLAGPDAGGVHTNSGVQNHWYYLLTEGGTGTNDIGDAFDVSAIGMTSSSAIAFRNLTVYLTDGSDHADARFFAIQSAIDLFGECSFEEEQTTNAWYAVGVGPEYVTIVEADFTASVGCFPIGEVDFTDASTAGAGTIDTWNWNFGDGTTDATENPIHEFPAAGSYPVELTVTNDLGCEDIMTVDIEVFDAPTVDFTASDLCEGDLTAFTDETVIPSGAITSWAWSFSDGTTAVTEDATHTFAGSGTFDVKLVATADNGCKDSITSPITITPAPTADFTFDNDCANEDADFVNTSTSSDGALLTDFTWDFGDGTPTSTVTSPTHTYAGSGNFDVTLDVVSPGGCTSTVTYTIERFDVPTADFTFNDVCLGEDAIFNDLSTITAPDVIASLDWSFGDGSIGDGAMPTHIYGSSGVFDVTLVATSANGCEDEITYPINVNAQPVANFSAEDECINEGPIVFNDLSTITGGTIASWSWSFDDGSSSAAENPINSYGTAGDYDVELTVTSALGCEDVITIPVAVFEKPTANLTADVTAICSPDCIEFSDLSSSATSTINAWRWNFENGDVSIEENPKICFNAVYEDQVYDVELIVTNDYGCKDTLTVADFVAITATPVADFSYGPNEVSVFDPTVEFTNLTENGSNYDWDFGDYTPISNAIDPTHIYPEVAGTYEVTLEAQSANGLCSSFASKMVTIKDVIIYYVPNSFTPDGDTFNETFLPVFTSGYDPYDFHFVIYNRWGEIVFETFDAFYGWNGSYGDLGLVESGVYVWSLDFRETMTDKRHNDYGHVTVLK